MVSVICAVFNAFLGAVIVFNIRKYTRRVDGAVANVEKTEVHINEMYGNCVAERLAVMNERLAITLLVSGAEYNDVLPLLSDAREDTTNGG